MQCDFRNGLICPHCGYVARSERTYRTCPAVDDAGGTDEPSFFARIAAYSAAIVKWIEAGRPTRSQEQIDAILAEHCNPPVPCEHFRDGTCKQCGCAISRSPAALRNKLAMATESCPIAKW